MWGKVVRTKDRVRENEEVGKVYECMSVCVYTLVISEQMLTERLLWTRHYFRHVGCPYGVISSRRKHIYITSELLSKCYVCIRVMRTMEIGRKWRGRQRSGAEMVKEEVEKIN